MITINLPMLAHMPPYILLQSPIICPSGFREGTKSSTARVLRRYLDVVVQRLCGYVAGGREVGVQEEAS